jgi:alkyl hydroperoxide reductase 1
MADLKVGDTLPAGITFSYIPYTEDKGDITACGIPINYDASKGLPPLLSPLLPIISVPQPYYLLPRTQLTQTEWANKKVVLFSVPGAFTPGCSAKHLPGYITNLSALKSKDVDVIACLAYNDAFVMSAWGKANNIKGDDIVCSAPASFLLPPFFFAQSLEDIG